jgi:hypothetical protein
MCVLLGGPTVLRLVLGMNVVCVVAGSVVVVVGLAVVVGLPVVPTCA